MAKYYLTKKAVEDLNGIWRYTYENWSEKQADKYYHVLLKGFNEVANYPDLGKVYNLILPNLRGMQWKEHIIFYRCLKEGEIEILRILHRRMDLKTRIQE